MAYDIKKLKGEPFPRYESDEAAEELIKIDMIDKFKMKKANEDLHLWNVLGIEPDAQGNLPKRGGAPSIFVMKKDENGVEKPTSLEDAGIKLGDRDFWHQAQLGNVFAYPAGSADPVQIKARFNSYIPKVSVSAPIKPENMPIKRTAENAQHNYRAPNWFTRALNRVFPGIRTRDCEIYREQQRVKKEMDTMGRRRMANGAIENENRGIPAGNEREKARQEKTDLQSKVSSLETGKSNKLDGKKVYLNMVAPQPVFMKEYEDKGFYTKDDFNSVQKIDKKLEDYDFGGKPLSEDEYCGLVAACTLDPKNALPGYKLSPQYDPTLVESLKNFGYEEQKAKEIVVSSYTTMITTDLMKGDLRGTQGNVLSCTVDPARKDVFDLLDKYKQGDKEPLAKAIVRGISIAANDTGNRSKSTGGNIYNHCEFANATADLLERDPELKELAYKNGLEEGDVQALRGMTAMSKAVDDRQNAKIKLAQAALNGTQLTPEEKRKCAEEIVTANLMEGKVAAENYLQKKSADPSADETEKYQLKAIEDGLQFDKDTLEYYAQHPEERPMPPKGKLYFDQVDKMVGGRIDEFNVHPDTLLNISDEDGVNEIKEIARKIVQKEGLANLDVKALNEKLVTKEKLTGSEVVLKAEEALNKGPELEAPGKQPEKQIEEDKLDPLNTGMIMKYS